MNIKVNDQYGKRMSVIGLSDYSMHLPSDSITAMEREEAPSPYNIQIHGGSDSVFTCPTVVCHLPLSEGLDSPFHIPGIATSAVTFSNWHQRDVFEHIASYLHPKAFVVCILSHKRQSITTAIRELANEHPDQFSSRHLFYEDAMTRVEALRDTDAYVINEEEGVAST